jgi:hypothetical protein
MGRGGEMRRWEAVAAPAAGGGWVLSAGRRVLAVVRLLVVPGAELWLMP